MKTSANLLAAGLLAGLMSTAASAADLGPLLAKLQAVGPGGAGDREAAEAWRELARADAAQLPTLLAALDQAKPLAANWIRTAVDAVAERTLQSGGTLPASELEKFLRDRRHDPRARRLAYEWLRQVDPTAPDRLIPDGLDDPSLEMRRDAVARLLDQADKLAQPERKADALALYRKALTAARDADQITLAAERLRSLGQTVDLARQFGFIVAWKVIGPFDNEDEKGSEKGYDAIYPPENGMELASSCAGRRGLVRWINYTTTDDYGHVDLNAALGEEKSVVGYATAEFFSACPFWRGRDPRRLGQRRQGLAQRQADRPAARLSRRHAVGPVRYPRGPPAGPQRDFGEGLPERPDPGLGTQLGISTPCLRP